MCAHRVLRSNIETGRGSSYFWAALHAWFGVPKHCGLVFVGGKKLIAPKIEFLRAHYIFGARQVFETTFGHIPNFFI